MTDTSIGFDPLDAVGGPGDIDGHYATFDADPSESIDELRKRYRSLARQWHPDRNPGVDTTSRMVRLNDAAAVLLDDVARAEYDRCSAVPPLVLFASPSSTVRCTTFMGLPGTRMVEVGSNRPVTAIDVSKLNGNGWSAQAFAGTTEDVIVILVITFDARTVGRVRDDIVLTADGATLWITIDATIEAAPTPHSDPTSPSSSGATPPRPSPRTSPATGPSAGSKPSKRKFRFKVAAWIAAVSQVLLGPRIISPDYVVQHFPRWSWSIAEFATSSTAMLMLAVVAGVLTRGFTRWNWRSGPAAILLLTPGIIAGLALFSVAAAIALAIMLFIAILGLFAIFS